MPNIDHIVPVKVDERIEAVSGFIGKVKRTPVLVDRKNNVLMQGYDIPTLNYIKEAVNNYYKTDKSKEVVNSITVSNITHTFVIPGTPMQKTDSKRVIQNKDGTFALCNNRQYSNRLRTLMQNIQKICVYSKGTVPIKTSVNAECVFYIKPAKGKNLYSIPYLLTTCIEELYKLKLIKSIGVDVVSSTDNSRIVFVENSDDEKTIINIRKITEG